MQRHDDIMEIVSTLLAICEGNPAIFGSPVKTETTIYVVVSDEKDPKCRALVYNVSLNKL